MISDSTKITNCYVFLTIAVSFLMAGSAWLARTEQKRASELNRSKQEFSDREFAKIKEKQAAVERVREELDPGSENELVDTVEELIDDAHMYLQKLDDLEGEIDTAKQKSTQYTQTAIVLSLILCALALLLNIRNRRENRSSVPSDEPSQPPKYLSAGE